MPETRYTDEYDNDGNIINRIPYEISDEELAEEAEKATCEQYLAFSPSVITPPQIWFLIRALAKKLGYELK